MDVGEKIQALEECVTVSSNPALQVRRNLSSIVSTDNTRRRSLLTAPADEVIFTNLTGAQGSFVFGNSEPNNFTDGTNSTSRPPEASSVVQGIEDVVSTSPATQLRAGLTPLYRANHARRRPIGPVPTDEISLTSPASSKCCSEGGGGGTLLRDHLVDYYTIDRFGSVPKQQVIPSAGWTIDEFLDYVLTEKPTNVPPALTSFTISPSAGDIEYGTMLTSAVTLSWTYSENSNSPPAHHFELTDPAASNSTLPLTTLTTTIDVGTLNTLLTPNRLAFQQNIVASPFSWKLLLKLGPSGETPGGNAEALGGTYKFKWFAGESTSTTLTSDAIRGLARKGLGTGLPTRIQYPQIDDGVLMYRYLAYPKCWGYPNSIYAGSIFLALNSVAPYTQTHSSGSGQLLKYAIVNVDLPSGGSYEYYVFRSSNALEGPFNMTFI